MYDPCHLSALSYSNGFTLWHYLAPKDDEPEKPGYFNEASTLFRAGDAVYLAFEDGRLTRQVVVWKTHVGSVVLNTINEEPGR